MPLLKEAFTMAPDDLALLIPITGAGMAVALATLAIHLKYRRMSEALRLAHAECLVAIGKGIKRPTSTTPLFVLADPAALACSSTAGLRRSGLNLIFAGGAITLALWQTEDSWLWWWGLVPVSAGLAKLLASLMEMHEQRRAVRQ
jgi:hypothetical protein